MDDVQRVPDTGPAAMADGLRRAIREARTAGQEVVAVEMCRTYSPEVMIVLIDDLVCSGIRVRITCPRGARYREGPCTCPRASAPAVVVRAEVSPELVPDHPGLTMLGKALPGHWRALHDPQRDLLCLLHPGGLWAELSLELVDEPFVAEVATALEAAAQRGMTGRASVLIHQRFPEPGKALHRVEVQPAPYPGLDSPDTCPPFHDGGRVEEGRPRTVLGIPVVEGDASIPESWVRARKAVEARKGEAQAISLDDIRPQPTEVQRIAQSLREQMDGPTVPSSAQVLARMQDPGPIEDLLPEHVQLPQATRGPMAHLQLQFDGAQLQRLVEEGVRELRVDLERQVGDLPERIQVLHELVEQGVQLLADAQPSELQRDWLQRARAALEGT